MTFRQRRRNLRDRARRLARKIFAGKNSSPISRTTLHIEPLEHRHLLTTFSEFVDPNPNPGNQFGQSVVPLSTGNVVVTSPGDDAGGADAGAVYLFDGSDGDLISTVVGAAPGDRVGFRSGATGGVTALTNGNYVVQSPFWSSRKGAATFANGITGVSGVVSATNSLVGSTNVDFVGVFIVPLTNGNYVVQSHRWDNGSATDAGAVTWGNGTTGISGPVSAANSLVGTSNNDKVGTSTTAVTPLSNGNYVVRTPDWDNPGSVIDAGAVTFGSGTTGISGPISATNSLVGTSLSDQIGLAVTALSNGNYVASSFRWDNGSVVDAGAATFASGTTGIVGPVSATNSLVGGTENDGVGQDVIALTNGNYVVSSPVWDNATIANAGAVTFGNGAAGITGLVDVTNSLVGSSDIDLIGSVVGAPGVVALPNGDYVVQSIQWDNAGVGDAGAITHGDGTTGVNGPISAANSLVGTTAGDGVGAGVTVLTNGNYVVTSPEWNNVTATDAGAATFVDGSTGLSGPVTSANSLVGATAGSKVGSGSVQPLSNNNYVVSSRDWNDGTVLRAGAATFGNGSTGISGPVSATNSLVGSSPSDQVGFAVTALSNGNYVVVSLEWDNAGVSNVGAATFGNGTTGVNGPVTISNSLVGSSANDRVGGFRATALSNGNYVVNSAVWNNGAAASAGAVTFGEGTTGVIGEVGAGNSLVGTQTQDSVGRQQGVDFGSGLTALSNGNFVVVSDQWNNGALSKAGSVVFGEGTTDISGAVESNNSVFGSTANAGLTSIVVDDVNNSFYARFVDDDNGKVYVGSQDTGFPVEKIDPGFPFVDVDNNDIYDAGTDILLDDGELDDGKFDTAKPEGPDYTVAIAGAGLAIHGAPISGGHVTIRADGNLIINTNLTATGNAQLESRTGSVIFDDPTVSGKNKLKIDAALDITSTDDEFIASGNNSNIVFNAGRDITLLGTTLDAGRSALLTAGRNVTIDSNSSVGVDGKRGRVIITGLAVNVAGSTVSAGLGVDLTATGGDVNVGDARLESLVNSKSDVNILATGSVIGNAGTSMEANETIIIEAGDAVNLPGSSLSANTSSKAKVELDAGTTMDLIGAFIEAQSRILATSAGDMDATGAMFHACDNPGSDIRIESGGNATFVDAELFAGKLIKLDASLLIDLTRARLGITGGTKGDILIDGGSHDITDAILKRPDKLKLKGTDIGGAAADTTKGTLPCGP